MGSRSACDFCQEPVHRHISGMVDAGRGALADVDACCVAARLDAYCQGGHGRLCQKVQMPMYALVSDNWIGCMSFSFGAWRRAVARDGDEVVGARSHVCDQDHRGGRCRMCVTKIMHHPLRYPGLVLGSFTHWSPLSKWGVVCVGRARVQVAVSRRRLRRGASRPRCLHVPGTSVGFLEYHTSVEEQWERLLRTGWAGRPRATTEERGSVCIIRCTLTHV